MLFIGLNLYPEWGTVARAMSAALWCPTDVPRQIEVWEAPERYILGEGPRKSGKSTAFQHKIFRHLVSHPYARVGLFSRTLKQVKQGAWADLTGDVYRRWAAAGKTKWTVEPKYEPDTKMGYCRVRSVRGGESELQIHSLGVDENVEERLKDTRFSAMYLIEADRFDQETFAGLKMQLRSLEVPLEYQQMLLDCNPPAEGKDHWLYKTFFEMPPSMTVEQWKASYRRIHFTIEDNPYLTEFERDDIFQTYSFDPIKLKRYWFGEWVRDDAKSVFRDHFRADVHIIGDTESAKHNNPDDQVVLRPGKGSTALQTGFDIGDMSTAVVFAAPRVSGEVIVFDVFDEVVHLNEHIALETITDEVVEKVKYWDRFCLDNLKRQLPWRHWSDSSSMRFKSNINGNEAVLVNTYSDGLIHLDGVAKGSGTVQARLDLLKRLLYEERIFISAKCVEVIDMMRSLKPGIKDDGRPLIGHPIEALSRYKHTFDALTYLLSYSLPSEMLYSRDVNAGKLPSRQPTPAMAP